VGYIPPSKKNPKKAKGIFMAQRSYKKIEYINPPKDICTMNTKPILFIPALFIMLLVVLSFGSGEEPRKDPVVIYDSLHYNDGFYKAESKGRYLSENYWGHVGITVEGTIITAVNFFIRDSSTHEYVDSMYGVIHYQSNPDYMQQCVNDGNGIKIYPQRMLQYQNIDDVDVISGATWSHNIFDSTTRKAFRNGIVPTILADNRSDNGNDFITIKPNPFRSTVTMEYHLTGKSNVSLGIFNSSGRLVKQLVNTPQTEGYYRVEWKDCPVAGIYYYRMQMDNQTICNKIVQVP
jgi:major membrane immunogen (membrane-anchored lipoprotein)